MIVDFGVFGLIGVMWVGGYVLFWCVVFIYDWCVGFYYVGGEGCILEYLLGDVVVCWNGFGFVKGYVYGFWWGIVF